MVTAAPRQIFTNCLLQVNNIISGFMGFPGTGAGSAGNAAAAAARERRSRADARGAHSLAPLPSGTLSWGTGKKCRPASPGSGERCRTRVFSVVHHAKGFTETPRESDPAHPSRGERSGQIAPPRFPPGLHEKKMLQSCLPAPRISRSLRMFKCSEISEGAAIGKVLI